MSWNGVTDSANLAELAVQVKRIADALDHIAPIPVELSPNELAELDKINAEADTYADQTSLDETLAMIEILEGRGTQVPDAAYKRFGLEPPDRKLATVDEGALLADQSELARGPTVPAEPPRPAEPPNPNVPAPTPDAGIVSTRKPGL